MVIDDMCSGCLWISVDGDDDRCHVDSVGDDDDEDDDGDVLFCVLMCD